MKLTTAGLASGFDKQIVGIVAMKALAPGERQNHILVGESLPDDLSGYRGALTTSDLAPRLPNIPIVHRVREIL